MKFKVNEPPREFSPLDTITLKDMGTVVLDENEQLTFQTASGLTNDITQKEWGYYLSRSLNHNLKQQGFKTALVMSYASLPPRLFLNLVEVAKLEEFKQYLKSNQSQVVCWLDEWIPEVIVS